MSTFTSQKVTLFRAADMRETTPLAKVIESFFISNSIRPATYRWYTANFSMFDRFITRNAGREPILSDLNHEYVNTFVRQLEKEPTKKYPGGSPFRARGVATALKRLASWCVEAEIFDGKVSPLKRVKKPRDLKDTKQPLTDNEIQAVLEATKRYGVSPKRNHAMIVFFLGTGLRRNELRELKFSDLDLRNCQVRVRPETCKTKTGRTVDFHISVAKVMDAYLRSREDLTDASPLFPTDEEGVFSNHGITGLISRVAQDSGVKRLGAHLCRHTWATNFMRGGGDLLQLKRQGGWSRMDMVERYSHAIPVRDRETLVNPLGGVPELATRFHRRVA